MTVAEAKVNLLDLSDEAFNAMVNQDVRGTLNPDTSALLRDPAIADRWYETLISLKRSVEAQLSANRAEQVQKQAEYVALGEGGKVLWMQARAGAEKWRAGAVRFKNGVEDRLAEARKHRNEARANMHISVLIGERDQAFKEVKRLRAAILTHREHECGASCDDDRCIADDNLWEELDAPAALV